MGKDTTAFRERFNAYKNGKSVSEIYDAGLPRYGGGKPAYQTFIEDMGPVLFQEMVALGVKNPEAAYRNMITLLAYESNYGQSRVARELNNFGGVGWNGKTYTTYKDKADFVRNYVRLMNSRYKNVITADTLYDYAKGLKGLNYYEDSVENYTRNLTGMKSFAKALDAHMANNPDLYVLLLADAKPMSQTTAAELNAISQFQPWLNYHQPDYPLNNPAPSSISSWNNPKSPAYTPAGLQTRRIDFGKIMMDMLEDDWEPPTIQPLKTVAPPDSKIAEFTGFKNGKLPRFKDGMKYSWDDQEQKWNRYTGDMYGDVFADFVVTPRGGAHKKDIKPLNIVSPEQEEYIAQNQPVISSDNDLYTRNRITEESNKRTWRSDVADVMHDIKEGALIASSFATPEIEPLVYPTYLILKNAATEAIQTGVKKAAPVVLSTMMRPQMLRMPAVINRFRNQEWSNFLSTKNSDAYFRINAGNKGFNNTEKYFISHTTPWEEFSGLGSEYPHGGTVLYEFPTNAFGKLKSSTDIGIPTNYDITEMGKNHLLYGNTSSGYRDFVKRVSDKNAKLLESLGIDPNTIGIANRPLTANGLYDAHPVYEDIHMSNQTAVRGGKIKKALKNTEYKKYSKTDGGIQKTIYTPLKYNGITPDWKNPINNALSVEQQDAMLGDYVGKGAERIVFTDRRYPGRVIKIGGGLNGKEKILDFELLKDAVEYAMEMNKLPGVEPISYEGFIDEKGILTPWFSQKLVIPMNKIADPFYTFSKPMRLPNGKPIIKGKLAAIRLTDYEKILKPFGYQDSPMGFTLPNYPYTIRDLGQKNIGFDFNGNLKIFDPLIDL